MSKITVQSSNPFIRVLDFLGISRPRTTFGFMTRFFAVFLSLLVYLPFGWICIFEREDKLKGSFGGAVIAQLMFLFSWFILYLIGAYWGGFGFGWKLILNPIWGLLSVIVFGVVIFLFDSIMRAINQKVDYDDEKRDE